MTNRQAQLPYGESGFRFIRKNNLCFVDKTRVVEVLERCGSSYPLFLRPRRFGKTLLINMLMAYYDKAVASEFDSLFQGTYIHAHKTPLQGQFYVLKWDFSAVKTDDLDLRFSQRVASGISEFLQRYSYEEWEPFSGFQTNDSISLLDDFFDYIRPKIGRSLYIFIDEYDQFANEVLSEDKEQFKKLTSKNGVLKNFYGSLKREATDLGTIARMFIAGVTSISLDSVTSGFSIQKNISRQPAMADAVGFTEEELRELIRTTVDFQSVGMTEDEIVTRMRAAYNGYRFSPREAVSVYNASMCLYYLQALQDDGCEPEQLADPAVGSDLDKVNGILSLCENSSFVGAVVEDVLNGKSVHLPSDTLVQFMNLNSMDSLQSAETLSMLYYLGYLTFSSVGKGELVCPNTVTKEVFFHYYFSKLSKDYLQFSNTRLEQPFEELKKGQMTPLIAYVSEQLKASCGLHVHAHLNEQSLQFSLKFAMLTNPDYRVTLEDEARGEGYCDLFFEPRKANSGAVPLLVEIKYLKASENKERKVQSVLECAKEQLRRYEAVEPYKTVRRLKKVAVIFAGLDVCAVEEV